LFSVALHEVGHSLGLADSNDPTSVMYRKLVNMPAQLSSADISAIQALYGARIADPNAVASGASPLAPASVLTPATAEVASGLVPLVSYGELTTIGSQDGYSFQTPQTYSGPMTLRVRTAGISLLEPVVNLYDSTGTLVSSGQVSDPTGGEVTLQVPATTPGSTYYVQIGGAAQSVFGVGRYAMAVSFDNASQVPSSRLESALQGPYDTWAPADLANWLAGVMPASTSPLHNTFATAIPLTTPAGVGVLPAYQATGSINGEGAVVYYQIVTPNSTVPVELSAAVGGFDAQGARPRVQLFDSQDLPVHVARLVNHGGTYAIQASGLAANQTYYVRVTGGESEHPGGYGLSVDFNLPQTLLNQVSTGQLTTANPTVGNTLFVAKPQYFLISLSSWMEDDNTVAGAPIPAVDMTILDSTGQVVWSLSAVTGDSATTSVVLLGPGQYSVRFTGPATGITQPLNYTVRVASVSDGVGPMLVDPTNTPLYQSPTDPNQFIYPVGTITNSIYLWVASVF
jgi:hypothetical protein